MLTLEKNEIRRTENSLENFGEIQHFLSGGKIRTPKMVWAGMNDFGIMQIQPTRESLQKAIDLTNQVLKNHPESLPANE